jgi:hypothetical protein
LSHHQATDGQSTTDQRQKRFLKHSKKSELLTQLIKAYIDFLFIKISQKLKKYL